MSTRQSKDNLRSYKYRCDGNYHFGTKENSGYVAALWNYNRSICFAENGSEQLALGYANRSAVFIELKMYKQCLADIALARSVDHYPDSLNGKLAAREAKCRALLAATTPDIDAVKPELSYPPHEKIPFVANCVEIRRNAKYGRHLVTNRDLKVGDVLAVEKPFCAVVCGKLQCDRCENCTEEHSRSLIPCESCTAVMFCSIECRGEAMRGFHKYECPAIEMIRKELLPTEDVFLPARMMLCVLALFDGDTEALFDYANAADANGDDTTVFEIDYTKRLTPFGQFAPIYCMVNAKEEHYDSTAEITEYLSKILQRNNYSGQALKKTVRHLMKIVRLFSFRQTPYKRIYNTRDVWLDLIAHELGSQNDLHCQNDLRTFGVYPFHFLLNHSCVPNLEFTSYGNQTVIVVSRPVKAGEQLFVCYGPPFFKMKREKRHQFLSIQCTCEACEYNYPKVEQLSWSPDPMPLSSAEIALLQHEHLSRKTASEYSRTLRPHLEAAVKYLPSKDWVLLSTVYGRCLLAKYEKEGVAFLELTNNLIKEVMRHRVREALNGNE